MKKFYERIKTLNQSASNYALTFIEDGGKILVSDSQVIWRSVQKTFTLPSSITNGVQEICGQKVYAESLNSSAKIVVCGDGTIALAVIRLAKFTGFNVTCIDDRPSFTEEAQRTGADLAICDSFAHALSGIDGDTNTYFVITTRGHAHDLECLRPICSKPHTYIGLLGSHKRSKLVREKLSAEGISVILHAPIGIEIETETPEEIAVSILAEVIREKNTRGKNSGYPEEILDAILLSQGKKVLMTIVAKNGSAPCNEGAKMLLLEDGSYVGTIGSGLMEARILRKAREVLTATRPVIVREDLTDESAGKEGMICGGIVDVMIEPIS